MDRREELSREIYSFPTVGPHFNKVKGKEMGLYLGKLIHNDYFVAEDGALIHSPNMKVYGSSGNTGFTGDRANNLLYGVTGFLQLYEMSQEDSDLERAERNLESFKEAVRELLIPGGFSVELENYTLEHFNKGMLTEFLGRLNALDIRDKASVNGFTEYCIGFCKTVNREIVPWNFSDIDPGEEEQQRIETERFEALIRQLRRD